MDREMRVTEIARAFLLRPQREAFPIKSMDPSTLTPSPQYSIISGDSGVGERADAQEESDALRDVEDQMDTLTMGECWAALSLSGLPPPPMWTCRTAVCTSMAASSSLPHPLQATSVVWTWSQRPALRSLVRPTPTSGGATESSFTSSKTPSLLTADSAGWR